MQHSRNMHRNRYIHHSVNLGLLALFVLVSDNLPEQLVQLILVLVQLQPPEAIGQHHSHSETSHCVFYGAASGRQHADSVYQRPQSTNAGQHHRTLDHLPLVFYGLSVQGRRILAIQVHSVNL